MSDLVTLCRNCHWIVTRNRLTIPELREFLAEEQASEIEETEAEPIMRGAFVMSILLSHSEELPHFNSWLTDIGEEPLSAADFDLGEHTEQLFGVVAGGPISGDGFAEEYQRLLEVGAEINLGNPIRQDDFRADILRLRLRQVESDLSEVELEASSSQAQTMIVRKRRIELAMQVSLIRKSLTFTTEEGDEHSFWESPRMGEYNEMLAEVRAERANA